MIVTDRSPFADLSPRRRWESLLLAACGLGDGPGSSLDGGDEEREFRMGVRHFPRLTSSLRSRDTALTPDEARARAVAIRGLAQARTGDFAGTYRSFREAVTLDQGLDLTRVPDFWKLPRQAHEAAIAAYEDAGLPGFAAGVTARVRDRFTPRLIAGVADADQAAEAAL